MIRYNVSMIVLAAVAAVVGVAGLVHLDAVCAAVWRVLLAMGVR